MAISTDRPAPTTKKRNFEKKLRQAIWRTRAKRPAPGDSHIKIGPGWRDDGFKVHYTSPVKSSCKAFLDVDKDKTGFHVGLVDVDWSCRQKGIGTLLYEIAAREACKRGAPLTSDMLRSHMSNEFWLKQYRKGRAEVIDHGVPDEEYPRGASAATLPDLPLLRGKQYRLSCPAPKSLAGRRRR
jgi:GNAT superfamily N-acetyltransferase